MRVILLVPSWIGNLEVLDGQARHVVHRDLEVHRYGANLLATFGSRRLSKSDLGQEHVLMTALELLDSPFRDLLLRLVLKRLALNALGQLVCAIGAGAGHWKTHYNLRCEVVLRELRTDFHRELESVATLFVNEWVDTEGRCILAIDAVVHNEEFAIGRVDRHCFHRFKVACVHTLVEVAVIEGDAACRTLSGAAYGKIVVQHEP